MLNADDWKIAIEDARHRHAAVVALIYFTDGQAMGLLRLYVTIGLAAGTVAAASLGVENGPVPWIAGWGLAAATLALIIGSIFCFRAMRTTTLNLPGRGAEFWLWAIDPQVAREGVLQAYLQNLRDKQSKNNIVNEKSSAALSTAKMCGVAALGAAFAGAVGSGFGW